MRPARAAVAKNIKNVAGLKVSQNKINFRPFTINDTDDYYKNINQPVPYNGNTLKSHSLVFG